MAILYVVYKHTSPSGKVYIGITKNNVIRRWGISGSGYSKLVLFFNAIKKYGWDNIKHEILYYNLTKEEAIKTEIELIKYYKSIKKSYNSTDGGEFGVIGLKKSKQSRIKLSELMKLNWKIYPERYMNKRTRKGLKSSIATIRKRSKAVTLYSLEGKYIKDFLSVTEAAKSINISNKSIIHCCNGGYECVSRNSYVNISQAGGYIWKYKELNYGN